MPPLAQHQLPVSGERQPARTPRAIAQLHDHELDGRVHGDVGGHLREDVGFVVLEDAVSEAVPALVPRAAAGGQRSGRPEGARLLVPDVERLPAAVADRVVVEGGQAELVSVLHPRVGAPALADDRPDVGTRDHVRPRRRRGLPGLQADDVFAAVGREAAEAVVERRCLAPAAARSPPPPLDARARGLPAGARPARDAAPARRVSRPCRRAPRGRRSGTAPGPPRTALPRAGRRRRRACRRRPPRDPR